MYQDSVGNISLKLLMQWVCLFLLFGIVGCNGGTDSGVEAKVTTVKEYSATIVLDWREDDAMLLVSNQQLRVNPPDEGYVKSLINEAHRIDQKGIEFDMEHITAGYRNSQPTWVRFIIRCHEEDKELILESCQDAVNLMLQAETLVLKKLEVYSSSRKGVLSSQLEKLYVKFNMVYHSFESYGLAIGCTNGEVVKVLKDLSLQRESLERQIHLTAIELKQLGEAKDELIQVQRELKEIELKKLRHQLELKDSSLKHLADVAKNFDEVTKQSLSIVETKSLVTSEYGYWWKLHGDIAFVKTSGGRFTWKIISELNDHASTLPDI